MPGLMGTSLGHYQLLERVGRGGMSEVYLAYDGQAQRNVAIKVVASIHADYIERFRREAYAVSTLDHAHILPAYDYGEQGPWHYMVMPHIELGTLHDHMLRGPLTLEEAGMFLEQVANALQFAHEQGIIHRDIKPSNILMRDEHYVYLADFGLAKSLEGGSTITQTGNLLGTPEYMAPELSEGPATTSSDLYALGILLYEMVTGEVPFSGETPIAVYWRQIRDQPIPPSQINSAIPHAIERVILRALEKDPQRRYQSANALAQAYIEALTFPDMVVEEVPPSASYSTTPEQAVLTGIAPINHAAQMAAMPIQEGQLVLPNNPAMAPTAVPSKRRRFVKRESPYLLRRRRTTPPPMESLMPVSPISSANEATGQPQSSAASRARPMRSKRPGPRQRQRTRRINRVLIGLAVIVILLIVFGLIALLFVIQYNNAIHHAGTSIGGQLNAVVGMIGL